MHSRIIHTLILALVFAMATPAVVAVAEGEKAAFRAAYKTYQEAVDAKDAEAIVTAAEAALDLGKAVFPDDSPSLAALHINFGEALLLANREKAAIKPLKEGIKRQEALYGKDDARLIDPLLWLAEAHNASNGRRKASKVLKRVRPLVLMSSGADSVELARVDLLFGQIEMMRGRSKVAIIHFTNAADALTSAPDASPAETGITLFLLGKMEFVSRRIEDAVGHLEDALLRLTPILPADDEIILYTQAYLSFSYQKLGRRDEAADAYRAIRVSLGDAVEEAPESESNKDDGNSDFLPLKKVQPLYPRSAQERGLQGWVLLRFTVSYEGRVKNPEVMLTIGGSDFSDAAIKAARSFVYEPRKVDGVPVDTENVYNLITFEIEY
jgi:TonB family protein